MQPLLLLFIAGFVFIATGCASLKPVQVVEVSGPDSLLTNEEGTFTASVTPEATQPVSGVWDFGDGTRADTLVAQHSYSVAGLYEVTFTASNRKGDDTASDSRSLEVVVEEPIRAPSIVSIDHDPMKVDTRSNATFSARVDEDAREVTGYSWSIDADPVSSEKTFSHTFPNTGEYEVGLTVANTAGSDSRSVTVDVHPYEAEICRDLTDLNPAFFDRNSSELSDDTRNALMENVEILNVCPNTCVSVTGYVDPNERRADELSSARAKVVEAFYTEQGVPASRVEAAGAGRVEGVSRKEGAAQFRRTDSTPMSCSVLGDAS
ncbi:MAG: PKD domain-containing protein [Rhodothermia bacterium]|nr:PKD domain-containing protein [Rhodothermia bacterium]